MIYKITNVEKSDFVDLLLKEIVEDLKNEDDAEVSLEKVVLSNGMTKGPEIQEVYLVVKQTAEVFGPDVLEAVKTCVMPIVYGVISAAIWDLLKAKIRKNKNLDEYSPGARMKIETIEQEGQKIDEEVSLEEILKK